MGTAEKCYCAYCGKEFDSEFELQLMDGRPCCSKCLPHVRELENGHAKKKGRRLRTDSRFQKRTARQERLNSRFWKAGRLSLYGFIGSIVALENSLPDFFLGLSVLLFLGAGAAFLVLLILELIAKLQLRLSLNRSEPVEEKKYRGPEF